jgi:hypothetical protein
MIGVPRSEWGNQAQWAVTAPLLMASLAGVSWATPAALGLCALSTVFYAQKLHSIRAYRVQVRLGFMALVGLTAVPGLQGILWLPIIGTTAQVLCGYCPMARLLDLMPWNRGDPLSFGAVVQVLGRRPGNEGLLIGHAGHANAEGEDAGAACPG